MSILESLKVVKGESSDPVTDFIRMQKRIGYKHLSDFTRAARMSRRFDILQKLQAMSQKDLDFILNKIRQGF